METRTQENSAMLTLTVDGMRCGHCVQSVTKAVEALPNVGGVTVDLPTGIVTVEGEADAAAVRAAIETAGFDVRGE
jgi:copper chaperone